MTTRFTALVTTPTTVVTDGPQGTGSLRTISTSTPQPLGVAAAGNATSASASNHVHPLPTPADLGAVPTSRTVNGHPLSGDVTVTGSDVGLGVVTATGSTAAIARTAIGLGGSAVLDVGTSAGTVAAGDDSRFTNARTPTGSAGGDLGGTYPNPTVTSGANHTHSSGQVTGLGGAALLNVGTSAGTVAAGDDSRLSNARTPTAHASTHASGGSDPVTPDSIGAIATPSGGGTGKLLAYGATDVAWTAAGTADQSLAGSSTGVPTWTPRTLYGLLSAIPSAVAANAGTSYFATDTGDAYYCVRTGSAVWGWLPMSPFRWEGAWSIGTSYNRGDITTYGGSVWRAHQDVASGGSPPVEGADWELFAQRGANGANGDPGPAGPAPSGTGLVSVTGGVLDTPSTLAVRVAADATNLRAALKVLPSVYVPLMGRTESFAGNQTTTWVTLRSHRFDPARWPSDRVLELQVQGSVTGSGTASFRVVKVADDTVVTLASPVTLTGGFSTSIAAVTLPGIAENWYVQFQFSGPTNTDTFVLADAVLIYSN